MSVVALFLGALFLGGCVGAPARSTDEGPRDPAPSLEPPARPDPEPAPAPAPEPEEVPVRIERECSAAAFGRARGIGRLKGGAISNVRCSGVWGGADVTGVGRALFAFHNGWVVVDVGPNACEEPTTRVCQVIGFK